MESCELVFSSTSPCLTMQIQQTVPLLSSHSSPSPPISLPSISPAPSPSPAIHSLGGICRMDPSKQNGTFKDPDELSFQKITIKPLMNEQKVLCHHCTVRIRQAGVSLSGIFITFFLEHCQDAKTSLTPEIKKD